MKGSILMDFKLSGVIFYLFVWVFVCVCVCAFVLVFLLKLFI